MFRYLALGAVLAGSFNLSPAKVFAHSVPLHSNSSPVVSGQWTPVAHPFPGNTPGTALLMTDGTVLMQDDCTADWYRLTADPSGNYSQGFWHKMRPMPAGYGPRFFASSVLPDGRVLVNGGEYNNPGSGCARAYTNLGALYEPGNNRWSAVQAPDNWKEISDAASVVLPDGHEMLQNVKSGKLEAVATVAPYPQTTVTWSSTGAGKADANAEEGWTPLANGDVLTLDIHRLQQQNTPAERYSHITGKWTSAGTAPNILVDAYDNEIGPAVRLPNGNIFQIGADPCGPGNCPAHTAIYSPSGTWTAGPDFPPVDGKFYSVDDGPAAVLPSGNVLVQASPPYTCGGENGNLLPSCPPSHFFEFDGTNLVPVNDPSSAPKFASEDGHMLVLPSGAILWSAISLAFPNVVDVEVYVPTGKTKAAWASKITSFPAMVKRGGNGYGLAGIRFQGVSTGAAYGDDVQTATNYPILRFKSTRDGHVCFAHVRFFSHTSAVFDMPAVSPPVWVQPCSPGPAELRAIANGIASAAVQVTVN